ncbi:hypothetical protein MMIC_P1708 [Mariprofundus micogutta]|uniref:Uncharacterized protein n=1 Tax=Mariprofundus micogutta TaxID=1921010 RepID=A0A1L8CP82_9PROT|nr:hypothetical protein MMIC_P1708 [Mariprofundus micogutta]
MGLAIICVIVKKNSQWSCVPEAIDKKNTQWFLLVSVVID